MKGSVIIAHPHPGSFNHAIAETAIRALEENWHTVCFHDLYQVRFDPVFPMMKFFEMLSCPRSSRKLRFQQIANYLLSEGTVPVPPVCPCAL